MSRENEEINVLDDKASKDLSCDNEDDYSLDECPVPKTINLSDKFEPIAKEQLLKLISKAWNSGIDYDKATKIFLSLSVTRLRVLEDQFASADSKDKDSSDVKKFKKTLGTFFNHEKKFLAWISALLAYMVYCSRENIVKENLTVMGYSRSSRKFKKGCHNKFLSKLKSEASLLERDSVRFKHFVAARKLLLQAYKQQTSLSFFDDLDESIAEDAKFKLNGLHSQLKNKLKIKRSNGLFNLDQYFEAPSHTGMFNEHSDAYLQLGLKKMLLKKKELE